MFTDAHPALLSALTAKGYTEPTDVQKAVLAPEARDRDLLVSSRTGSGKTVAFGLSLANLLLDGADKFARTDRPLGLVVAPTRELAQQVLRELQWLYQPTGMRSVACVGGMDLRRQQEALKSGMHIVVGTPGRLCDHLDQGYLKLDGIKALVLDEADEMLDMGFRDELDHLVKACNAERRTFMFSATLPAAALDLASKYQKNAMRIVATDPHEKHADIEYRALLVAPRERDAVIVNVLRQIDPQGAIVFCNTREGVSRMHSALSERGFAAVAISGDLGQFERNRALQALRDGRARVLVATDVAARGLDLPDLELVIHADLPTDSQAVVHRSGRTGRAGKKGIAVMIVPENARRFAERLFRQAGLAPIKQKPPTGDEVRAIDAERLVTELSNVVSDATEEDRAVARKLMETGDTESLIAAWVAEARARRPSPEDLPQTAALYERFEQTAHRPKKPDEPLGETAWFRVNVGRADRAHPHWLLPLLCRRGKVEREQIGRMDIRDNETRFQVAIEVADEFARAVAKPDRKDPKVRFQRMWE